MIPRVTTVVAAALLLLAPAASRADLPAVYTQNFESLTQSDPGALSGSGWSTYVNVFPADHLGYIGGYGFPSENNTGRGSGIDFLPAGPQGLQDLVVYSDYVNGDIGNGQHWQFETNVYREMSVGALDAGSTWYFQFEAKRGNLNDQPQLPHATALAFIKTLDPANGYATTNFITIDMTSIPQTFGTHTLSIPVTGALVGQLLQIGFANTQQDYQSTGVFYDNIVFTKDVATSTKPMTWGSLKKLYR